ncbi:hypothetical protein ACFLYK_01595 [Candidatus Cloacimonadota bacterium]
MIKMHSHSKYIIIILIFIVSILVGIKTSNLKSVLDNNREVQESEKISKSFNSAQHYRKLAVIYQDGEIDTIVDKISKLAAGDDIELIYSEGSNSYFHYLLEIRNNAFEKNYALLHQIEGFLNEKIDNNNKPEYDINIDEHISNKELAKVQLQALLQHSAIPERVSQYNQQLEEIQEEIDILQNRKILQDKFENYTLVSILALRSVKHSVLILNSLKEFLIYTAISLLLIIILFTVLYVIFNNLLKFMKLIGIRTSSSSASYYYSPKKKKIKRKYKDKEEN